MQQQTLLKQTLNYLRSGRLIAPGQHIMVAVSGGRDSCVMLHILHALREELGCTLSVAHFDHNLRDVSREEQIFVGQLAENYGLPFYAGFADVPALAAGGNIEDTARQARYAFLRQAAGEAGAQLIATAHHAQDQAETVLLHLLRGSGVEGLAAISPLENGLLRPLLLAQPQQIEAYRAAENLEFRQDESNADAHYLRNHLRLNILPQLAAINPRLLDALSATADICREDNALLDALAAQELAQLFQTEQQFLGEGIYALPSALQRRVLRLAVQSVAGADNVLSYEQTTTALGLKEEQSICIGGGWLVFRRGGLHIGKEQPPVPRYTEIIPLLADGCWHSLAAWGWEYRAEYISAGPVVPAGPVAPVGPTDSHSIALPASMAGQLAFRTRLPGDSVPSSGKAGQKKLKDIFIEAKIPQYQRASWPVLLAGPDIIWLPRLYQRQINPVTPAITITAREKQNKN